MCLQVRCKLLFESFAIELLALDAIQFTNRMAEYLVVTRAQAGVRFAKDDAIVLRQFPTPVGPADILIKTRLIQLSGFSKLVPMGLMAEVRGSAPTLDQALQEYSKSVQGLCPIIVLVGNSPIEDMAPEIGYDVSPGKTEREYFQHFMAEFRLLIVEHRRVSSELVVRVLRALVDHADAERIRRATGQYYQALRNWEPGQETLALAHLWMGMEALTPVTLRRVMEDEGVDKPGLLAKWNIEIKSLDSEVRRRVLMQGDDESYKRAKSASDGFEHGFLGFNEIFAHADAVRDKVASYLRKAIIDELKLEAADVATLLADQYMKPGHLQVTKYLRGLLVGTGDRLAPDGFDHPFVEWKTSFREIDNPSPDQISFKMEETITPRLAEGIAFKPRRLEAWGGQGSPFVRDGV